MLISVDSVAILNRQRQAIDYDKLSELAASIKETGLLHPIVVRHPHSGEDSEGKPYVLVVGGRRLAAHILLDRAEIEASLKEELDPLSAEVAELDENLRRENLSIVEEVEAKARIHALRQRQLAVSQGPIQTNVLGKTIALVHTVEDTAEELGESARNFSRDLRLAELIKADPTLKLLPTKSAMIRAAAHKADVAQKVKNVSADSGTTIRSKLFIGDGVAWAKTLPNQCADLIFSDLPYGIDQFENQPTHDGISRFDDSPEAALHFMHNIVPEMARIIKPDGWICLFMCYEWHAELMQRLTLHGKPAELPPWLWIRKDSRSFGHWPELHAANRYEMIVVANGGDARFMQKPLVNVLDYDTVPNADKIHNHQKPLDLCQELIQRFTVPGELVVDFCFGSGMHLAAAASIGRDFLGCEKNPLMLDVALSYIAEQYKAKTL